MLFPVIALANHLVGVFLDLIYIAFSITAVKNIDGIDSGGWSKVFSSLFLVLVVAVLLFFSGLGMGFLRG